MSLVLAVLIAAAPAASPAALSCNWRAPGDNPFMGDVVAAVDRYRDIPIAVRNTLKARMTERRYDEIVSIRRDAIVGKARYATAIQDMHFGTGQVCASVDRSAWAANAQERGLVYCEAGHCILVPTVCRNVSRITRVASDLPSIAGVGAARDAAAGIGSTAPDATAAQAANSGGDAAGGASITAGSLGGLATATGVATPEAAAALPLSQAGAAQLGDNGLSPTGVGVDSHVSWIDLANLNGSPIPASESSLNADRQTPGPLAGVGPSNLGLTGLGPAPAVTPLPISTAVPEPGSVVLLLAGLLALGLRYKVARQPGA